MQMTVRSRVHGRSQRKGREGHQFSARVGTNAVSELEGVELKGVSLRALPTRGPICDGTLLPLNIFL